MNSDAGFRGESDGKTMRKCAAFGVKGLGFYLAATTLAHALRNLANILQMERPAREYFDTEALFGSLLLQSLPLPAGYLLSAFILIRYTDFCLHLAGLSGQHSEMPRKTENF